MELPYRWTRHARLAVITPLLAAACAPQPRPTVAPLRDDTVFVHMLEGRTYETVETVSLARLSLLPCPGGTGESVQRTIGPEGGTLSLRRAGHSLGIPAGAVRSPTEFTLIDVEHPRHLKVSASGAEGQVYEPGVTLTIDYARCPEFQRPANRPLRVIRERLSGPGEDVGADTLGVRTLRVHLDRLSGFAVAY